MLKRTKDKPLYSQLEQFIKEKIEDNIWKPGQLIPSEAELINQYGVSRTTVRQALGLLVFEGYLQREKGKGTFVTETKFERPLNVATSFTNDIISQGHKPGSITLFAEEIMPSVRIATKLRLRNNSTVIKLERIRTVDGKPVGLHTSSIVRKLVPNLKLNDLKIDNISLYEILQKKMGLKFKEATETLEASIADEREKILLGVAKGFPILHVERITYLTNGRPIEHVDMIYLADHYKPELFRHFYS
jgi:GntR family transcriptional regulator